MFDIGWSEMLVILVVALVVIGPRDLPKVARQVGRWTGKARAMAREFQRSFDDMAREAELEEIKAGLQKMNPASLESTIRDTVDPDRKLEQALDVRDTLAAEARSIEAELAAEPAKAPPAEPAAVAPPAPAPAEPALAGGAERPAERS
jgi:sec-independent protein translocase protein TatB